MNVIRVTESGYLLFFFSSRRRHTRLQGDWSSDVCSSDLIAVGGTVPQGCKGIEIADCATRLFGIVHTLRLVDNDYGIGGLNKLDRAATRHAIDRKSVV